MLRQYYVNQSGDKHICLNINNTHTDQMITQYLLWVEIEDTAFGVALTTRQISPLVSGNAQEFHKTN